MSHSQRSHSGKPNLETRQACRSHRLRKRQWLERPGCQRYFCNHAILLQRPKRQASAEHRTSKKISPVIQERSSSIRRGNSPDPRPDNRRFRRGFCLCVLDAEERSQESERLQANTVFESRAVEPFQQRKDLPSSSELGHCGNSHSTWRL